jgi:hypothetical protein
LCGINTTHELPSFAVLRSAPEKGLLLISEDGKGVYDIRFRCCNRATAGEARVPLQGFVASAEDISFKVIEESVERGGPEEDVPVEIFYASMLEEGCSNIPFYNLRGR